MRQRELEHTRQEQQRARDESERQERRLLEETRRVDERAREVRLLIALTPTLAHADLSGHDLKGMHLAQRNLSHSKITGTLLDGADLTRADLRGCFADGTSFRSTSARGVNLTGASIQGCDLSGADLSSADLAGARITGSNLTGAILANANLRQADLYMSDLSGADIGGADFTDAAGLITAVWTGTRADDRTRWPDSIDLDRLSGLRRYRSAPPTVQLICEADWSQTHFAGTLIVDRIIRGGNFRGAWIQRVDFYNCQFVACDFSGADLRDASGLVGATFVDCVSDSHTDWPTRSFDPSLHKGLVLRDNPEDGHGSDRA